MPTNLRSRLTLWYVSVLALLLFAYAAIVFAFQYIVLTRQMLHDEIQDVVTVEGLLYIDANQKLQLRQDYFSRPQSRLLVDRYMEVRDTADNILYSSATLRGMRLGGPTRQGEGDRSFDERIVRLEDGSHVFLISHVHGLNGQTLLIRLGYSLAPLRTRMLQFLLLLIVAIPAALLLAAAAGQAIAKRALRPIDQMTERATQITVTSLNDRLAVGNPQDELGRMAIAFNHLLGRLDEAFQQLSRFTSDAAHELRAPLAAIRTVGEVALGQEQDVTALRKTVEDLLEEASHLNQTVDSLLLLSQVETIGAIGELETVRLLDLWEELIGLMSLIMEDAEVRVLLFCPAEIYVRADRNLLRVALLNVLHNSWKFSPPQSTIQIECDTLEANGMIQIAVQDEGPGMPVEEQELVFKRFYTGSSRSVQPLKGTGLGLSITKLIVERCGGSITFDRAVTSGSRCLIYLPQGTLQLPERQA